MSEDTSCGGRGWPCWAYCCSGCAGPYHPLATCCIGWCFCCGGGVGPCHVLLPLARLSRTNRLFSIFFVIIHPRPAHVPSRKALWCARMHIPSIVCTSSLLMCRRWWSFWQWGGQWYPSLWDGIWCEFKKDVLALCADGANSLFVWSKETMNELERKVGNTQKLQLHAIAYLWELCYDLLLAKNENVSVSPGFESLGLRVNKQTVCYYDHELFIYNHW